MTFAFIKTKKFIIPAIIVVVIGGLWYRSYKAKQNAPKFDTVTVTRGVLKQTVDATGKIESTNDVSLRFEVPGTVASIPVKEGDKVAAGTVLATLRLTELNASVAQAQANLAQRLAGATDQDKSFYKAAMDSAKAAWDQSKIDAVSARDSLVITIHSLSPKLDDALTQADNILGIDNTLANQDFRGFLSVLNSSKLGEANLAYTAAKNTRAAGRSLIDSLTTQSSADDINTAEKAAETSLNAASDLLTVVSDVLKATVPNGTLSQTTLDAKKTVIEATRSGIIAQYSALIQSKQNVIDRQNGVNIKEAAYNQAAANYDSKIVPPREVDVASLRAVLSQTIANRDKAIIRAPMAGVVTKVNKKIGESVSGADAVVQMLVPHYQVKVDIPETDVSKLKINDVTEITLDAFGEDVKFSGNIISIDPASTEVQDVVYYKVTVSLADSDKPIKPGMTANVNIMTNQRDGVITVPLRAVRTRDDGTKYVRVLENNAEKEVTVKLGIRGDEGKVEALEGVSEGQQVIVGTK